MPGGKRALNEMSGSDAYASAMIASVHEGYVDWGVRAIPSCGRLLKTILQGRGTTAVLADRELLEREAAVAVQERVFDEPAADYSTEIDDREPLVAALRAATVEWAVGMAMADACTERWGRRRRLGLR